MENKNKVLFISKWLLLSVVVLLFGCNGGEVIPISWTVRSVQNDSGYDIIMVGIAKLEGEVAPIDLSQRSWNIILRNGEKIADNILNNFLDGEKFDLRIYINGVYIPDNLGERSPLKKVNYVSQSIDDPYYDTELIYTLTKEDAQRALNQ